MKSLINIILIGIILCFFGCSNKTGYEGSKLDGKPHGQGVLYATEDMGRLKKGDKVFEGEFKDGEMYKGTFYQTNGRWFEGTFKDGKPWDAKEICPEGGHLYDFKEGRKLAVN